MKLSDMFSDPPVGKKSPLPKPEATGWTKRFIDDLAAKMAREVGYRSGEALEPIVTELGGRIVTGNVPETGSTGYVEVEEGGKFLIALSPIPGTYRNNFTIAHELGHYFLHSRIGEKPLFATRQAGDRAEWEANWFAAGFLMPAEEFVEEWKKAEGSIGGLINRYQLSGGAIEIRRKTLEELGYKFG